MEEINKEVLTLQLSRMEEMIKDISEDVKETKADVKNVETRVRDIEEIVRTKDTSDKLVMARIETLERRTSIIGFCVDNSKLVWGIFILILLLLGYNNKELINLIGGIL